MLYVKFTFINHQTSEHTLPRAHAYVCVCVCVCVFVCVCGGGTMGRIMSLLLSKF